MVEIKIPSEFAELLGGDWREAAVYGGRYSLKSHTVARILLIRAMQSRVRVGCFREFQNSIEDSSHQLLSDLIKEYDLGMFEVTRNSIVNNQNGSDFLFKGVRHNSQNIKSIEGIDIGWVEEAQTITKDSIEILTPTIRKEGSQIIWTYNRLTEMDPIHKRLVIDEFPNTLVINVDYRVADKYGWLADETKAEIEHDQKTNPSLYAHKWLGEPISQAETAIINRDAVLEAMSREIEDDGQKIVGVDVARMGSDRTVFWMRKGLKTIKTETHSKLRTTQVCDKLEVFINYDKKLELKVDDSGVGGGVTDEMMKRGYNVVPINFGGEPNDKDKYPNWISEAWFYVASIVDKIQLPQENELLMELTTRQWVQDNKGKRKVESKNDYKKRGYRSPDLADAMIISYAPPKVVTVDWGDATTAL
jgi:phage terminase large subunit